MVSFSWLHDETFFPVSHVLMPFCLAAYFPKNTCKVVALIYIWETIECVMYWLNGSYGIFQFIDEEQESMTDSLLLDPLQGILGVLYMHTLHPPTQYPTNWKKAVLSAAIFLGATSIIQWNPLSWIDIGYVFFILATCIVLYIHKELGRVFILHVLFFVCFPLLRTTQSVVYRTWIAMTISILFQRVQSKAKQQKTDPDEVNLIPNTWL